MIGAGLRDYVDHGSGGAALFGAEGIGGDAKLLHDFGGDLEGSAIASASLGEEGVVVVAAIDQRSGLKSADAAEGKIAAGGRGEAARVLGDVGGEQREVREAAPVKGHIAEGAFVEERRNGCGLSFDQGRCGGDSDIFMGSRDGEVEFQICGVADIDVQLGRDLRRHSRGHDSGGVIAGREQVEGESPFGVAGGGEARGGCNVRDDD